MKKIWALFFAIALVCSIQIASSAEIPDYYDKYVNDFGKIFNENETASLRALLYNADQNTTAEVVIVTVNTTSPDTPADYALKIFDEWKVGKADKDNGLVILYALTENKIWVATGYGLEGILPDSKIGRMLDDYYVPLRDQNKTKEGIIAFTEQAVQVVEDNKAEVISGTAGGDEASGSSFFYVILSLIILTFIIFFIKRFGKKSQKKTGEKIKNKQKAPNAFAGILDVVIWILIFIVAVVEFNVILILALIIILILRHVIWPQPSFGGRHSGWAATGWSSGGGFGGGGGGFGGGGFGGGGSGGGGAGR